MANPKFHKATLIMDMFGIKPKRGDIGIEIEAEGRLTEINDEFWKTVPDGSLRNGLEYVLKRPIFVTSVPSALKNFSEAAKTMSFRDSLRTSVHIHVNVSESTLGQTFSAIVAFWLLENALVHLNGPMREGNLFCLRAKDSEAIISAICDDVRKGSFISNVATDNFRYSALNLAALGKYGSLEFRFLKGTVDPDFIQLWSDTLVGLVRAAEKFDEPNKVLDFYENATVEEFSRVFLPQEILGQLYQVLGESWWLKVRENYPLVFQVVREWSRATKKKFFTPVINAEHEDIDPSKYKAAPQPEPFRAPDVELAPFPAPPPVGRLRVRTPRPRFEDRVIVDELSPDEGVPAPEPARNQGGLAGAWDIPIPADWGRANAAPPPQPAAQRMTAAEVERRAIQDRAIREDFIRAAQRLRDQNIPEPE